MLATLTAALLLGAPPATETPLPAADVPPARLQLFGDESWYKDKKGEEKDFTGQLSAVAPPRTAGGRFNPYRLTAKENGKQLEREVYVGAHPELLAAYVGRRVHIVGKPVDTEVEGQTHAEIWPSWLELKDTAPTAQTPQEVPSTIDLMASNKVYQADATPEKEYVGWLSKKKGEDAVGYTIRIDAGSVVDRQDVRLMNQQYSLLDPYNGMRVKIWGKKTSGQVGGVAQSYIMPGKLEVLDAGTEVPAGTNKPPRELKILARAEWESGAGAAPIQLAIRSADELVHARGQATDRATDESVQNREIELATRMFKVEKIDFAHQMIVVASAGAEPTGGYSVEVTQLVVQDEVLTVHWRLNAPKPGDFVTQTVTHPAQAVLTELFPGKVVFQGPPKAPVATPVK